MTDKATTPTFGPQTQQASTIVWKLDSVEPSIDKLNMWYGGEGLYSRLIRDEHLAAPDNDGYY